MIVYLVYCEKKITKYVYSLYLFLCKFCYFTIYLGAYVFKKNGCHCVLVFHMM